MLSLMLGASLIALALILAGTIEVLPRIETATSFEGGVWFNGWPLWRRFRIRPEQPELAVQRSRQTTASGGLAVYTVRPCRSIKASHEYDSCLMTRPA